MATQNLFAFRRQHSAELFEQATYVHTHGEPPGMGRAWFCIARLPQYRDSLMSLAEDFILANPVGWHTVDHRRDLQAAPISPEREQALVQHWRQNHGWLAQDDPELYERSLQAYCNALPLVSYRARNLEALERAGLSPDAERHLPQLRALARTRNLDAEQIRALMQALGVDRRRLTGLAYALQNCELAQPITPANVAAWSCFSWGYLLDVNARQLEIYRLAMHLRPEQWSLLQRVALDGPEPDWVALARHDGSRG